MNNPFAQQQQEILKLLAEMSSNISVAIDPATNSIHVQSFANNIGRLMSMIVDLQAGIIVNNMLLFAIYNKQTDPLVNVNDVVTTELDETIKIYTTQVEKVRQKRNESKIVTPNQIIQ